MLTLDAQPPQSLGLKVDQSQVLIGTDDAMLQTIEPTLLVRLQTSGVADFRETASIAAVKRTLFDTGTTLSVNLFFDLLTTFIYSLKIRLTG
ncbi:hypothetical protein [Pseudomonas asplenii]|uniref:hypothetical protein n=1 Tax=Pseudomonas asplenii TaxID=53407 RepID=UPI0006B5A2AF|nr:hypothetical protein [Pseudomonas fuscovaginae]